eukprot:4215405-Alexandrium_andersonii.AAC.1
MAWANMATECVRGPRVASPFSLMSRDSRAQPVASAAVALALRAGSSEKGVAIAHDHFHVSGE